MKYFALFAFLLFCVYLAKNSEKPQNLSLRERYELGIYFWPDAEVDENVSFVELGALPLEPPYPAHNQYSKEKVELGKKLFNDPRLSKSNQIACANCHDSELGFGDGRRVSFGHDRQTGRRNSPSIIMSAFGDEKFWDGRAKNLEEQALMPLVDPLEMAMKSAQEVADKLNLLGDYEKDFQIVFGTKSASPELIAKAIATYERSLMPKNSRFDRFLRGEKNMLSDKEIQGLHLFRTKAKCMNCHYGPEFSDNKYHNLGLSFYGRAQQDLGRYEVTKRAEDVGAFKTPSLRKTGENAPYMHNGQFKTLRQVINIYAMGMFNPRPNEEQINDPLFPKTSPLISPFKLTNEEAEALEAFLKTL